jgi:hypothetical protein
MFSCLCLSANLLKHFIILLLTLATASGVGGRVGGRLPFSLYDVFILNGVMPARGGCSVLGSSAFPNFDNLVLELHVQCGVLRERVEATLWWVQVEHTLDQHEFW